LRDPDSDKALAKVIYTKYGFQPLALDLLNPDSFYFYLVLEAEGQVVPVPLPEGLDKAGLKRSLESGLKRFAGGFLKTLALYTPPNQPELARFGMGGGAQFDQLREKLGTEYALRDTDLRSGRVPEEADLLLVVAPQTLDTKQLFAIDQFLMQGGTVLLAASPFHVDLSARSLAASPQPTGLEDWFNFQGVKLGQSMVLDPQNTPFPIPVERRIGGYVVQEIHSLAYPYFPDIREDGMDRSAGLTCGLGQVTINWASPVELDADKNKERRVLKLLSSSAQSWTSPSADIQPNFSHGDLEIGRASCRERVS
jgi:ABC-2 type transport system permease protein